MHGLEITQQCCLSWFEVWLGMGFVRGSDQFWHWRLKELLKLISRPTHHFVWVGHCQ